MDIQLKMNPITLPEPRDEYKVRADQHLSKAASLVSRSNLMLDKGGFIKGGLVDGQYAKRRGK